MTSPTTAEGAPAVGHTPGPWHVEGDSIRARIPKDRQPAKRPGVAPFRWLPIATPSCNEFMTADEVGANLHLLAAAPELLAALKALVALHDDGVFAYGQYDEDKAEQGLIDARAALRKAGL